MNQISLIGFDSHRIKRNLKINFLSQLNKKLDKNSVNNPIEGLYIGGILTEKKYKFVANSDGDLLIHAIIDSLSSYTIGKDIGQLFPDDISLYKNYSSILLLEQFIKKLPDKYRVKSIDAIIVIDVIKIALIKEEIISNLQNYFPEAKITIKGKRTEGGFKKNYAYCWVCCNLECV